MNMSTPPHHQAASSGPSRCRLCVCILAMTLILLFPARSKVVPNWTVRVIDQSGRPVAQAVVRQQWKYEPFERERHEASDMTRENGVVSFPTRYLRMSLAERAFAFAAEFLRGDPHADWGRNAQIIATAAGFVAAAATYQPGKPLPTEIHMQSRGNQDAVEVP